MDKIIGICPTLSPKYIRVRKLVYDIQKAAGYENFEIIVSHDTTKQGFTKTVNKVLRHVQPNEYVLIFCDDITLIKPKTNFLVKMKDALDSSPDYGFAGVSGPSRTGPMNTATIDEIPAIKIVKAVPYFFVLIKPPVSILDERFIHYRSDMEHQYSSPLCTIWITDIYVHTIVTKPISHWWQHDHSI